MKTLILLLLLFNLTLYASATDSDEYDHCNCDDEEALFSIHTILVGQKVSDFFIAIAYFSIPIELLYFVSRSNVPFKLLFLQFIAFIVLCGMTHLLNAYSYHSHPSFQLLLSLTVAKFLTALVSCATALTLPPLIPLLLRIKVREIFLRQNVMELGQEVGIMKKQKEASWHVRMLTREIRKSLDKHTILYTTLVELSKALDLHNCAVWMPNDDRREMYLTHELKSDSVKSFHHNSIPVIDPDVLEIRKTKGVRILRPESKLGAASSGGAGTEELGAVAAIRMPMLHVSNFKGGTPELVDTCYAILVLVLPGSNSRVWTAPEMEIVEVVADQVAVALSHASVLEESHLMREKLEEQNRALQQSQKNAMMASQARKSFQTVMSHGLRRPMHSVVGMLSLFQEGNMRPEQKIIGDTMLKVGNVLSSLVNDVMDISENKKGGLQLEMKPFLLHSMLREAACIAKCLCVYQGFGFQIDVEKSLPKTVLGDEARTFQVILHIIGYLLNTRDRGNLVFRVFVTSEGGDKDDKKFGVWRSSSPVEYVDIKFDFQITGSSQSDEPISTKQQIGRKLNHNSESKEGLSFNMCRRLVQIMQGNIWILPNSQGLVQGVSLLLKFQIGPSLERYMFAPKDYSNSQFGGLKILLADDDGLNRIVTKKLLERLGCLVTAVSSGFECLGAISGSGGNSFKIIMLDIHMPEMDGFEVAARIRKFNGPNWPLIIALIANAEEQVKDRCMLAGMNGVIRKPILLHQIADELRSVLLRAEKRDWRMKSESEAAEYFSKDFEWEELRSEVESNPSLRHHFQSSSSSSSSHSSTQSPDSDVHAWKQFHTRHSSGKFFKERRYLLKEFPQLLSSSPPNSIPQKLLEVGCGNGSTILPILRANKDIVVYACDCSDETLEKAKEIINENYNAVDSFMNRFHTFCCDFSTTGFPIWLACNPCRDKFLQKQSYYLSDVKEDKGMHLRDSCSSEEIDCCVGGVDFITLIFTLSAVPLERMPRSIKGCFTVLKPGGMVLFRDYGLYDMTMLRFEPDKRVGFREYMRSDGTRSYFFCLNTVRNLFLGAGFIELELDYCCVKSVNRRKGKSMQRVWVHAKFQKPVPS